MLESQLQKYFGFSTFKQGQETVIQKLLEGHSSIAIFPTGAGKSLCYQLPAMLLPHLTLVVSPLLSLMKDQLDFLESHHIPAARLDSTLEKNEYNAILEQAKRGALKILMISVERFKNERFRSHLQRMKVSLMVIDEAHCISEWGHNFRPEYLKLPAYRQEFNIAQVLLLTATATPTVVEDMRHKFQIHPSHVIVTGFYRKNLFLQVSAMNEAEKKNNLLKRIQEAPHAPTIVYVTLQQTAEDVANYLGNHKVKARHYHAGMENEDRERVQNDFMEGRLNCIVATIAFGMGIDKKDIRRVIHYNLPKSIENYSQEIGRSGRDGKDSLCEIMANRDNVNVLENFIYGDTPEKKAIRQLLQLIQQNEGFLWEIKPFSLSNEVNIRQLPLKTLLVYLDLEGVIRPKFTYFEKYSFKYRLNAQSIIQQFQGERSQFVSAIFKQCYEKTVWTLVDIQAIVNNYATDRQRVITALEYFEEKGWIELQSEQAVEVFDIMTQAFDLEQLSEKMYHLFQKKEEHEIHRIHQMVSFFESSSCLSHLLAQYFGEHRPQENCGHCSVCKEGQVTLRHTMNLKPLSDYNFEKITHEFIEKMGEKSTPVNLTKFLCGISTPLFAKLKIKKLPYFGLLENYAFLEVQQWIPQLIGTSRQ
ncbi:RecQ family ATP-dependent DNA helicase [Deltaproteobacteria bacterium TL4]